MRESEDVSHTYLKISIHHVSLSMQVVQRRHNLRTVETRPLLWEYTIPWQVEEKLIDRREDERKMVSPGKIGTVKRIPIKLQVQIYG